MKSLFLLLLTAGLCLAKSGDPESLLTRLRDDMKTLASGSQLKPADGKKANKIVEKLDKSIDAVKQGKKADPGDVRKALDDAGKLAKTLPDEQRDKLYEDIRAIREKKLDAEPKARRQNDSRMPGTRQQPGMGMPRSGRRF